MIEEGNGGIPKQQEKIDILAYWRVVWKRRWLVLMFAAVVLAAAAVKTFTSTPIYSAKGTLLIEKEPNILTFEEILQIETLRDDYYQTQFKLLKGMIVHPYSKETVRMFLDDAKKAEESEKGGGKS